MACELAQMCDQGDGEQSEPSADEEGYGNGRGKAERKEREKCRERRKQRVRRVAERSPKAKG